MTQKLGNSKNNIINNLLDEYHHLNLWYFVSFIFGIVIYLSLDYEPSVRYISLVFISSIATLYFRKYGVIGAFFSGIIIFFVLGIVVAKYRTLSIDSKSIDHSFSAKIEGKISLIKPVTNGDQITLSDVFLYDKKKEKHPFKSSVRLNVGDEYLNDFMVGDKISLFAFLTPPHPSLLPGGYNFELYNFFSSIGAIGYAMTKPEIIYKKEISSLDSYIHKIRRIIYARLINSLGSDNGNFAAAILLGEGKALDKNIMQNMRYAGISHILCVSGLHLSLVAMLFYISSRFLLNSSDFIAFRCNVKVIASFISLIGSFLYLMLSGMQIAATRAFIMTAVFILSIIIGRTPYPLRSIAIASIIILVINPEYIMHPSFQLSFIAVLSLISGFEFYMKHKWMLGYSNGILAQIKIYLFANIYSSLLAGFATMPIVVYHFYIASNYGALSNLLAVPVMSFLMMPLAILSVILMPFNLDYYVLKILGYFISIIIKSADFIASLPGSIWYFGYISHISIVIYMFGFFWLILWQKAWRHLGWIMIAISIISMFLSKKPDIIFDPYHNNLGIQNKDGKLEIHSNNMSGFIKKYWSNWFGQKEIIIHKYDITETNKQIITNNGSKINICFKSLDCDADIIINPKNNQKCDAKFSITRSDLRNNGTILLFCSKNNECIISSHNASRFKF